MKPDIDKELIRQCQAGSLKGVKDLVAKGVRINAIDDGNGRQPIHIAARNGNLELVKYLLEEGAHVNAKAYKGEGELQPIHYAVQNNNLELVKYLLTEGAHVNAKASDNYQPIHYAAAGSNCLELAKYLLKEGADFNAKTSNHYQPIHYAVQHNNLELVKCLLEAGADVNAVGRVGCQPIHYAVQINNLELVKCLLEKGADINAKTSDHYQPIHYAVQNGNLELVKYLLTEGAADVNAKTSDHYQPIHYAVQRNDLELVKYLLTEGAADVNAKTRADFQPIHYAVQRNDLELVKYLLEAGADVNAKVSNHYQPIHYAARNGKLELVKYLLEKSADVNAKANDGCQPIHDAIAGSNCLELVKCLLEAGADVNAKTSDNYQPIHGAARNGNLELAKYLLEEGADVNAKTSNNYQPIHYAARDGKLELVKYLLEEEGAKVRVPNISYLIKLGLENTSANSTRETWRYLLRHFVSKEKYIPSKIQLITDQIKPIADQIKLIADKKEETLTLSIQKYWEKFFKEEILSAVISIGLVRQFNRPDSSSSFLPRILFSEKKREAFVSPCNVFNVAAEIDSDGKNPFTSSSSPSEQAVKKTVIISKDSFFNGRDWVKPELIMQATNLLLRNGFEVYLAVKDPEKESTSFTSLHDKEASLLTQWLSDYPNNINIVDFTMDKGALEELAKQSPQISADDIVNINVADIFLNSALSLLDGLNPEIDPINPRINQINVGSSNLSFGDGCSIYNGINSVNNRLVNNRLVNNGLVNNGLVNNGFVDNGFVDKRVERVDTAPQNDQTNLPASGRNRYLDLTLFAITAILLVGATYQNSVPYATGNLRNNRRKENDHATNPNGESDLTYSPENLGEILDVGRPKPVAEMPYVSRSGGDYEITNENENENKGDSSHVMESIGHALNVADPEINTGTDLQGTGLQDFAIKESKLFLENLEEVLDVGRTKPVAGMAYVSRSGGDYEITNENENKGSSSDVMESIGYALNDYRSEINIRTGIQDFVIEEGKLFFRSKVAEIFDKITPKILSEAESDKLREASDLYYFKFSTHLKANQRKQLYSVSSHEDLVGIIGDAADVKIEKSNDGFFYATSLTEKTLSYVIGAKTGLLERDFEELLPSEHPIQKIIDDYRDPKKDFYLLTPQDFELPKNENGNLRKWLNQIYETRSGSCRYRVAAVLEEIIEKYPDQKNNVRIVGINGNHVILEVREKEGSEWLPINLGGSPRKLEYLSNPDNQNDRRDALSWRFIGNAAFALTTMLGLASQIDRKRRQFVSKQNELESFGKYEETDLENQKRVQLTNSELKKIREELKSKARELFKKKGEFVKIENPEDVYEAAKNKKLLLLTKESENAANFLIRKFTAEGKKVFYLDAPHKIFREKTLRINGDGKPKIYNSSEFDNFLTNNAEADRVLIINWKAFNNKQMLALNNLLDEGSNIASSVVSLVENAPKDVSFLSRHQSLVNSDSKFASAVSESISAAVPAEETSFASAVSESISAAVPAEETSFASAVSESISAAVPAEEISIDLEGVADWRQKLFGEVVLVGDKLEWNKSEFCVHLEALNKTFSISNISDEARGELEKELSEARSRGYFDYHGYELYLPQNLKFKFDAKSFDLAKFGDVAVNVRSNVKLSNKMPENTSVVNTYLFDRLLQQNLIENKKYFRSPGLVAANAYGVLNLFVTSKLSNQQYYCMLNEAQKNKVTLNLYLAPNVNLPKEINIDQMQDTVVRSSLDASSARPKIVISNDTDSATEIISRANDNDIYAVIDVEDYNFLELFHKITYSRIEEEGGVGVGYSDFNQVESELVTKLRQGKKIILKGDFSSPLLASMHEILCGENPIYSNLTLIVEAKQHQQASKIKELEFLDYEVINREVSIPVAPQQNELKHLEDTKEVEEVIDLENSEANAEQFLAQRKKSVADALATNSVLQIVGHSGVGKSSLLKILQEEDPGYEVYDEMTNFESWANDKSKKTKILFVDEANISEQHLTKFSPLKSNDKVKRILHNGKFFDLDENHKVVFARNPNNYSSGRVTQKLFDKDVPVIYFRDFPSSYIYEEILNKPIYKLLNSEAKDLVPEKEFKETSKKLITEYQEFNRKQRALGNEINCKTVRELQEEMLLHLNQKIATRRLCDIQSSGFVTTEATKEVEQALFNAIMIRSKQREGIFGNLHAGLNSFVIEGDPGVGKSELISAVLAASYIRNGDDDSNTSDTSQKYYRISAGMSEGKKRQTIVRAFEEGNILWIDEVNSCINEDGLEKILNAALTGKHPDGRMNFTAKVGFMMISSINPPFLGGRSQLSPALKHRSTIYQATELANYKPEDVKKIADHCLASQIAIDIDLKNDVASAAAEALCQELQNSKYQPTLYQPTLRDLKQVIKQLPDEIFRDRESKRIPSGDTTNIISAVGIKGDSRKIDLCLLDASL